MRLGAPYQSNQNTAAVETHHLLRKQGGGWCVGGVGWDMAYADVRAYARIREWVRVLVRVYKLILWCQTTRITHTRTHISARVHTRSPVEYEYEP